MTKPPVYIVDHNDRTFDAFVEGKGFAARVTLPQATAFIREATGRRTGAVPCWCKISQVWDSEIDIAEGA